MRLPDSYSQALKPWKKVEIPQHPKFIIFLQTPFVSPSCTIYEVRTSFNWDGDTKLSFYQLNGEVCPLVVQMVVGSISPGGPIELFLVPASAPQPIYC